MATVLRRDVQLRFPLGDVNKWASRYAYPRSDAQLDGPLRHAVRKQRYFTRDQLIEVCRWKSPRAAPKSERNDSAFVEAVTGAAIATANEQFRIEALTVLNGVSWPIASVLLHFGVSDDYPILDFRALWSLSIEVEPHEYRFALWEEYVQTCRSLAAQAGVSVRIFDKALWQYSKERQPDDEG